MYQLDLFGGISLEGPDGPLEGRVMQRHPLALLSILAASPHCTCSRERMIGLLWPDQPEDRARHNLSDTLYVIHKSLGPAAVQVHGDLLHLDCTIVQNDVCEFEEALTAGRREDAVALCRGPVLDGFQLDTTSFDEWCEAARHFYRTQCNSAVEYLAREADARGDLAEAIKWWKQRARQSPYNSVIARICVQALLSNGDPGDAVRFAQEHIRRLRDDLGVEPPEDLVAVAEGHPPLKVSAHEYDPPPNPAAMQAEHRPTAQTLWQRLASVFREGSREGERGGEGKPRE